VTAYQLTSMMEGVVERGTASRAIDLPVPIAGKTGTTNDVKDVWFVGYLSNIAAGCYIGYDTPRPWGRLGRGVCAPVFQEFMAQARAVRRRALRRAGRVQLHQHRPLLGRAAGGRRGGRERGVRVLPRGEEPIFGITFDGGFEMAGDLPLVEEVRAASRNVTTSTGDTATVGDGNASFGTVSSGGSTRGGGDAMLDGRREA
jgi:penicillin-binding protein 1A